MQGTKRGRTDSGMKRMDQRSIRNDHEQDAKGSESKYPHDKYLDMDVDGSGDGGEEGGVDEDGSKLYQLSRFVDRLVRLDKAGVGFGLVRDHGFIPEIQCPTTHHLDLVIPGAPGTDFKVKDPAFLVVQHDRLADLIKFPGLLIRSLDRDVHILMITGHVVQGDGDMVVRVGTES